jgi:hypothetical protein
MTTKHNHGWTKDLNVAEYPFFVFFKKIVITREDHLPYLIRTTLISIGKWFSLKLHEIVMSDDACIHDHPWAFISLICKGGYYEWTYLDHPRIKKLGIGYDPEKFKEAPDGRILQKKWYGPGSILYRPAKWAHSLELKVGDDGKEIPCNTFVITFPVIRKWGFFTKSGWIYWRKYNKGQHCND